MANTDKDKERKVKADRTEAKVKSDRQKSFYTKQRKQAEEGASEGDTKAKGTRDKIYSKIGRKPGPDADDADVVNKGALAMVGGPEALGADAAMGAGRMALGKLGAKIGGEGMGKLAEGVMSKFGKGGKTADKATSKTVASGRTVKATAKGIDKGSRGHKGLGNQTMKQAPKDVTGGLKKVADTEGPQARAKSMLNKARREKAASKRAPMKIDGQKGATAMARKSVKGGKSTTAKAAVKSSASGVESASTKMQRSGQKRMTVKASDKPKYEAAKKTAATEKKNAQKQARGDYMKSTRAEGTIEKPTPYKPKKVEKGDTIDGQTGKTIKKVPTKSRAKKKS